MTVTDIAFIYLYKTERHMWESASRKHHILSLQLSGHYDHDFGDRILPVRKGSLFFINRNESYTVTQRSLGEALCVSFSSDEAPSSAVYDCAEDAHVENLFRKLYALRHIETEETKFYAMAVLYELLGIMMKKGSPEIVRNEGSARIEAACRYIHAHFRDGELTNDILAEKAGLGKRQFVSLFAKHYRTTPAQYIIELRLMTAAKLLEEGLSVTQTAYESGFHDIYYFSRIFKRRFLVPPSEFFSKG